MATFSKMAVWPTGYFRAYSSWLLRNRRDVLRQVRTISAEIQRIGFVRVSYLSRDKGGEVRATEERVGFAATSGSSLSRLCQAYIANGGNPLDISPFWHPDGTEVRELDANGNPVVQERYPDGCVAAPISVESNSPAGKPGGTGYESYEGGWIRSDRYYPARQNGRRSRGAFDSDSIVRHMHAMRGWANQAIKERLQNIEWQIIRRRLLSSPAKHRNDSFGHVVGVLTSPTVDHPLIPQLMNLFRTKIAGGKSLIKLA